MSRPSRAGTYVVREGTDRRLGRYYHTYVENGTRYFKWSPLQALAQTYDYQTALGIARDKGGRLVLLKART